MWAQTNHSRKQQSERHHEKLIGKHELGSDLWGPPLNHLDPVTNF